jgi:hypothetical protein
MCKNTESFPIVDESFLGKKIEYFEKKMITYFIHHLNDFAFHTFILGSGKISVISTGKNKMECQYTTLNSTLVHWFN